MIEKIPSWGPYVLIAAITALAGYIAFKTHTEDFETYSNEKHAQQASEIHDLRKEVGALKLRTRVVEIEQGKMVVTLKHLDKTSTNNSKKLDLLLERMAELTKSK